jgi:hypothetical protein
MPFRPDSGVEVKETSDKEWSVLRAIEYDGERDHFTVPVGQSTDFASVPRVFAWFIPPYGKYTMPAILHDYLWRRGVREGLLHWYEADALFRRAMRELGVPFLRRWIMWAAVRLASIQKPGGSKEWFRRSWGALLIAIPTLAVLIVPVVAILASLLVVFLAEVVAWVPLRIAAAVRAKRGRPQRKEVIAPKFSWKL